MRITTLRRRSALQPRPGLIRRRRHFRKYAALFEGREGRAEAWEMFLAVDEMVLAAPRKERARRAEDVLALVRMARDEPEELTRLHRRAKLTPETARAAVEKELSDGREPSGEMIGDLLTVDPLTRYLFKRIWREVAKAMQPEPAPALALCA